MDLKETGCEIMFWIYTALVNMLINLRSDKRWGTSCPADRLLASQEVLIPVKFSVT
jgi:hypothetical protein